MSSIQIKTKRLSSRERRCLEVLKDSSGAVSTEILKRETGLDHGRIHRTLDKLKTKGYIELSTRKRLPFYKSEKDLEEVLS